MSRRARLAVLVALLAAAIGGVLLLDPVPQDPAYHRFADQRALWGIPNFGDVASNAAFALAGAAGLAWLARSRGRPTRFETVALAVLFAGVLLTAFGSAYYHLEPTNARLVWDRLPMTLSIMALLALVAGERLGPRAGAWSLGPLILTGAASVLAWHLGEQAGRGDLRFYGLVQFLPLLAIPLMMALFPPAYSRSADVLLALGLYALAKLLEQADRAVFATSGGLVSGHTLKHLVAAAAAAWLLRMVRLRAPLRAPV